MTMGLRGATDTTVRGSAGTECRRLALRRKCDLVFIASNCKQLARATA